MRRWWLRWRWIRLARWHVRRTQFFLQQALRAARRYARWNERQGRIPRPPVRPELLRLEDLVLPGEGISPLVHVLATTAPAPLTDGDTIPLSPPPPSSTSSAADAGPSAPPPDWSWLLGPSSSVPADQGQQIVS